MSTNQKKFTRYKAEEFFDKTGVKKSQVADALNIKRQNMNNYVNGNYFFDYCKKTRDIKIVRARIDEKVFRSGRI